MSVIDLKIVVWKEGKHYVAQCLNVDVSSFGTTKQEAVQNLQEALELYFEDDAVELVQVEQPEVIPLALAYA